MKENLAGIPSENKKQIERDVREMAGITQDDTPVILDLESIRVVSPGKFEIDIVNLFNKKRPLIYKLEEGKYIIDLASTLNKDMIRKKRQRNLKIGERAVSPWVKIRHIRCE